MYLRYTSSNRPTNTKGAATERKDAKGAKEEGVDAETESEEKKGTHVTL